VFGSSKRFRRTLMFKGMRLIQGYLRSVLSIKSRVPESVKFIHHSLFRAPCSIFAFVTQTAEKISNKEQGLMNVE